MHKVDQAGKDELSLLELNGWPDERILGRELVLLPDLVESLGIPLGLTLEMQIP